MTRRTVTISCAMFFTGQNTEGRVGIVNGRLPSGWTIAGDMVRYRGRKTDDGATVAEFDLTLVISPADDDWMVANLDAMARRVAG